MSFSNYSEAVIAIAANSLGYTKSVSLNSDGTLDWHGEETHPTDDEMTAAMPAAQTEFDTNGVLNDAGTGRLDYVAE